MAIFDDLIKALLERNSITLDGGITISLIDGGVQFRGEINSTVRDRTKGDRVTATMLIPVKAQVEIGEIQIPVQIPQ